MSDAHDDDAGDDTGADTGDNAVVPSGDGDRTPPPPPTIPMLPPPVLPPPTGPIADAVARVMARMAKEEGEGEPVAAAAAAAPAGQMPLPRDLEPPAPMPTPAAPSTSPAASAAAPPNPSAAPTFGRGRRYDLAWAALHADAPATAAATELGRPDPVESLRDREDLSAGALELARPPPGSAQVRPSVPAPKQGAAGAAPGTTPPFLNTEADALLTQGPDGAHSFAVTLNDDQLGALNCDIVVKDGRITAAFVVHDVNTRRLLEAEAGRLRVQLEARGLRVESIEVVHIDG